MVFVVGLLLLALQAASAESVSDLVAPPHATGDQAESAVRLFRHGSPTSDDISLSLRHVRLESSAAVDEAPSSTLKFDVHNEGDTDLADIELSISLLGPPINGVEALRTIVVRPFTIRLNTVLMAGYILQYEIRLRNLSSECDCVPKFQLLDARALSDDQP